MTERLHRAATLRSGWDDLIDVVEAHEPVEIGIDLFDTVITRRVVDEASVERAVAARQLTMGLWTGSVESWLCARRAAVAASPNGSICDWYRTAGFADAMPNWCVDQAIAAEVDVESELIELVPGAVEAIARLRAIAPVRFVTDMHLPADGLAGILDELGVEGDGLFVSGEIGASKVEASLFGHVFGSKLSASEQSIVFIGNSDYSDGLQARRAGLRPVLVTKANPSRYEAVAAAAPGAASAIAGASRLARLRAIEHRGDHVGALGAQTVGQIMSAFLLWLREISEDDGVRDLRFLARDGELPLLMARAMEPDHWSGYELHYLHCSRRAWALAAAGAVGVDAWLEAGTSRDGAFLVHSADQIPFAVVIERIGLTWSQLPPELRLVAAEQPLGPDALPEWAAVLRSGVLDSAVAEASAKRRRPLVDHLRTAGFGDAKIGLVDVGWTGQLAWMAQALIAEASGQVPVHYHFGGEGVTEAVDRHLTVRRFAFDDSVGATPVPEVVTAMEIFLGNGKPRLIGYEDSEHGVVEVFESSGSGVMTPTRQALADGAVATAAELPSRAALEAWAASSGDLAEAARSVIGAFWLRPERQEMQLLADLQFEIDLSGDLVGPVMSPYTLRELVGGAAPERQWRTGSLRLTPAPTRALITVALRIKDLIGKLG